MSMPAFTSLAEGAHDRHHGGGLQRGAGCMHTVRNRIADGIAVGDRASLARTLTSEDPTLFAARSGGTNPQRLAPAFAASARFQGDIAPGRCGAALTSALLGTRLRRRHRGRCAPARGAGKPRRCGHDASRILRPVKSACRTRPGRPPMTESSSPTGRRCCDQTHIIDPGPS